jgi:hypothetical protein
VLVEMLDKIRKGLGCHGVDRKRERRERQMSDRTLKAIQFEK